MPGAPSRYERQLLFAPLGAEGQVRLGRARVGLVGCGALGSFIATHLVRAGVGYLRLVDRDYPQLHNLHRQILYTEEDVARKTPKAEAAAMHLREANSEVVVEPLTGDINPSSIRSFAEGLDLLVDATDNFPTRFLLNDLAVERGMPWVYGGVIGASGMSLTIVPGDGPCLRCIFPRPPAPGSTPTCDTAGVLSTAVAVVASIQANEALKLIVDPASRSRTLLSLDVWDLSFDHLTVARDADCPCCGRREFTFLAAEEEYSVASLCGRDAVQISPRRRMVVDLAELEGRLAPLAEVRRNRFLLEAEVEGVTLTVFPDGRALVGGIQDLVVAQSLYAKYVGH